MRSILFGIAVLGLLLTPGYGSLQADSALAAGGSTLNRPEDPVVLTGADIPALTGIVPHDLVAFRYDGAWTQIPVQVDERDTKTFGTVYNGVVGGGHGAASNLFYTDPDTWTGADSNATFDTNDEVAFMSNDAGGQPPSFSEPANIVAGTGVEIAITDPLAPTQHGWVYLFRSDGSLDPGAAQSYVSYTFSLDSGNYKATYTLGDTHPLLAGNPENSTITSPNYTYHFGDRWQEDQMQISIGGATNVDILDRHKAMFAPGVCGRTEDTFDGYISTGPIEGAFVANKSGPVRAIRSYVGANSGPLTQRDHIFYSQRHEIRTNLRVHSIPSVMDFFDYSPAASGMMYYNSLNTGGVLINGTPDVVTAGAMQWQMATGAQGTVVNAGLISTNIPGFAYTSYYFDQSAPGGGSEMQCTGDATSYGSSGTYVNSIPGGIPCTDPGTSCTNFLNTTNVLYYEPPSQSVAAAQALNARANAPLSFVVQPWGLAGQDTDGDFCPDVRELGADWHSGGQRNPNSGWDFFDVPVPALLPAMTGGLRNRAVSLADVGAVLTYIGATAGNPTHQNASGAMYGSDLNSNTIADGQEYDRTPSVVVGELWHSGAANGAISLQDAAVALAQVGTNCN